MHLPLMVTCSFGHHDAIEGGVCGQAQCRVPPQSHPGILTNTLPHAPSPPSHCHLPLLQSPLSSSPHPPPNQPALQTSISPLSFHIFPITPDELPATAAHPAIIIRLPPAPAPALPGSAVTLNPPHMAGMRRYAWRPSVPYGRRQARLPRTLQTLKLLPLPLLPLASYSPPRSWPRQARWARPPSPLYPTRPPLHLCHARQRRGRGRWPHRGPQGCLRPVRGERRPWWRMWRRGASATQMSRFSQLASGTWHVRSSRSKGHARLAGWAEVSTATHGCLSCPPPPRALAHLPPRWYCRAAGLLPGQPYLYITCTC